MEMSRFTLSYVLLLLDYVMVLLVTCWLSCGSYSSDCRWSASENGGALESLGFKEGYRVDVDVPDSTWAQAANFHDILIFNTGHW
jgi:hypothetical protein